MTDERDFWNDLYASERELLAAKRELTELREECNLGRKSLDTLTENLMREREANRIARIGWTAAREVVEAARHGDRTEYEAEGIDPESGDSVPMMVPLVVFQGSDAVNLMEALDRLSHHDEVACLDCAYNPGLCDTHDEVTR